MVTEKRPIIVPWPVLQAQKERYAAELSSDGFNAIVPPAKSTKLHTNS